MKKIRLAVLCGLIAAMFMSMARFDAHCDDLRENVLRLHIVANSDSPSDQRLKLIVRDAVLAVSGETFTKCKSLDEAKQYVSDHLALFEDTARKTLAEHGCTDTVRANIETCYFENRVYDTFTLPAGEYEALNLSIGEGRGHNWWCVMFPAVCIGASGRLDESVNSGSAEIAENSSSYQIRFKTVEVYEKLKKIITKK